MTSLAKLLPEISEKDFSHEIEALNELGIVTDVDLHFIPLNSIPFHRALSPSTIATLREYAGVHLVARAKTGAELLDQSIYPYIHSKKAIEVNRSSSRLPSLDAILDGGWERGEVIEISGASGSGKTLIIIHSTLLHLLLNPKHRIIYLDSLNSFDPHRWNSIAEIIIKDLREQGIRFLNSEKEELSWETVSNEALERIDVSRCLSSGNALDAITRGINDEAKVDKTLTMVVIDSVTNLLEGDPAGTILPTQVQANLISFLRIITSLSRSPSLPLIIFLLNSTVSKSTTSAIPSVSQFVANPSLKPALGSSFSYLTEITLWVSKADHIWEGVRGKGRGVVEVARNRRGTAGGWVGFTSMDGIKLKELSL